MGTNNVKKKKNLRNAWGAVELPRNPSAAAAKLFLKAGSRRTRPHPAGSSRRLYPPPSHTKVPRGAAALPSTCRARPRAAMRGVRAGKPARVCVCCAAESPCVRKKKHRG